jgi:glycosyltransferase involved in cell wall biosynthesis
MAREAPRTLLSLSATYQRHISANDYEVIVVDNGSKPALNADSMRGLAGNFRLIRVDKVHCSPAYAINCGLAEARGAVIGVMIDGARIATPGLLHFARCGARLYQQPVVAALGWYLGHDLQRWSPQTGYDHAREDQLLKEIGWPDDGYRLFEIGTMDESSDDGWFAPISESNALFLRHETWRLLGGVEEKFDAPGGGYLNLDTFSRAVELPESQLVILLGEGTFHQLHGGISTNSKLDLHPKKAADWATQYKAIRGRLYARPTTARKTTYLGVLPRTVLARFVRAASMRKHPCGVDAPLGEHFDQWLRPPLQQGERRNLIISAVIDIAHKEFQAGRYDSTGAIARLALQHAPNEAALQRLLSLVAFHIPHNCRTPISATFHLALATANRALGNDDAATWHYQTALVFEPNLVDAHIGLALLRMTGEDYLAWLDRLYALLAPRTLIEIGVYDGASIARARSPTIAIGVDPTPKLAYSMRTQTHVFAETSDGFFERQGPDALLTGHPLGVGFIDGLHLYEQVLKDFINLERYCGPRSVILLHDTIPLDEATQLRIRNTTFHTGDVWKMVLCLKQFRSDLDVFTIATPPTGLTVVTGFGSAQKGFLDYETAVATFIDKQFSEIASCMDVALNIIPNDWKAVECRLRSLKII